MTKYQCMNFVLLVMVCVCCRRISGHSSKKSSRYDIDNFIKQLLSSQKFDELTDIVAEKAAKKIKYLAPTDNISKAATRIKQSSNVEEIEKEKNDESNDEESQTKKLVSNEASQHKQHNKKQIKTINDSSYPEGEKKPTKEAAPVKINTEALLKQDDSSGQAELSLKYKNLKKHARNEKLYKYKDATSKEPNPWKHLQHSKVKKHNHASNMENQERNSVSAEKDISSASKSKKANKKEEKTYDSNERNGVEQKDEDSYLKKQPKKAHTEKPRADVYGEKKETEEIAEDPLEASRPIKEEFEEIETTKVSEDGIMWRAHNSESEKGNSEDADGNDQTSSPVYELGELTTKKFIRKEGNRYYTYLSGPEYAEFHEQLAKEEKSKNGAFR